MLTVPVRVALESDLYEPFDPSGRALSSGLQAYLASFVEDREIGQEVRVELTCGRAIDERRFQEACLGHLDGLARRCGAQRKKRAANALRLLVPHMVERGRGMVMNLASAAALCPGPYMSVYYASKAYVLSFSEALHEELHGTGVTVTALCPGPTATGFEAAAEMGEGSTMFRHADGAEGVARNGVAAMLRGKAVSLQGAITKRLAVAVRIAPRWAVRRGAARMNR